MWTPVNSSNVAAIDYDAPSQVLSVRFHSGSQYNYKDVPEDVYESFLTAPSAGRYFNQQIKDRYRET